MIDWDAWRRDYDSMSYEDQIAFYDRVWSKHSKQEQYHLGAVIEFFEQIPARHVVEVGGWRGELARDILSRFPNIEMWRNYEVCRPAAAHPATKDSRYAATVPLRFVWNMDAVEFGAPETIVLSHIVEHMKIAEVARMLDRWPTARFAYVETPINLKANDWTGYTGTHIIDAGWTEVASLFLSRGFDVMPRPRERFIRAFRR